MTLPSESRQSQYIENSRPLEMLSVFSPAIKAHENERVKKGRAMQQTLWGERLPQRRRKKIHPLTSAAPFSITGNDCTVLGHTLREWDLAGCTICIDCQAKIFCPRCIAAHPQDENAIALLCERHEEPQEIQVSA